MDFFGKHVHCHMTVSDICSALTLFGELLWTDDDMLHSSMLWFGDVLSV